MASVLPSPSGFITRGADVAPLDVFGTQVTLLADGAATGGACSVARIVCPPGAGAPPHRHAEAETFHVLQGRLTVTLDGRAAELQAGDLVHVAPHAPHDFRNLSGEPVTFLALGMPAGHEAFFRDADELARTGRFNPATAAEVCRRHGIELLLP